jgi:AcrR family transcriptional regulator
VAKRGRPATFDRAEAVERATELFWARGYEGVTLEDLQAAMGNISPPSFYHAFGSKEALFREAVERYMATVGASNARALESGKTARESVDAMLRLAARSMSRPGKPRGCLLVHGAINCSPANSGPQEFLRGLRQRAPKAIKQRLDRAVAEGELPPDVDTGGIAAFYATVAQGLGLRAGDGASQAALMATVDGAMAAWDTLTSNRRTTRQSRRHAHVPTHSTSAKRTSP